MTPIRLRVREIRQAKGLSQEQLARMAGIRRASLSAIEAEQTTGIDFATLEALAGALDVDAGYLIEHRRGQRPRASVRPPDD